jgi:hypothetical protein
MRAAGTELRAEGIVRVMHPDEGMGVEFTKNSPEHRAGLEKFLSLLHENRDVSPELMVEPEGLETEASSAPASRPPGEPDDTLLGLFHHQGLLPPEVFQAELRKQRGLAAGASV